MIVKLGSMNTSFEHPTAAAPARAYVPLLLALATPIAAPRVHSTSQVQEHSCERNCGRQYSSFAVKATRGGGLGSLHAPLAQANYLPVAAGLNREQPTLSLEASLQEVP